MVFQPNEPLGRALCLATREANLPVEVGSPVGKGRVNRLRRQRVQATSPQAKAAGQDASHRTTFGYRFAGMPVFLRPAKPQAQGAGPIRGRELDGLTPATGRPGFPAARRHPCPDIRRQQRRRPDVRVQSSLLPRAGKFRWRPGARSITLGDAILRPFDIIASCPIMSVFWPQSM